MQQIWIDEGPVVVLALTSYVTAGTDKLAFNEMASNWEFDGWKFSERWWFKS